MGKSVQGCYSTLPSTPERKLGKDRGEGLQVSVKDPPLPHINPITHLVCPAGEPKDGASLCLLGFSSWPGIIVLRAAAL